MKSFEAYENEWFTPHFWVLQQTSRSTLLHCNVLNPQWAWHNLEKCSNDRWLIIYKHFYQQNEYFRESGTGVVKHLLHLNLNWGKSFTISQNLWYFPPKKFGPCYKKFQSALPENIYYLNKAMAPTQQSFHSCCFIKNVHNILQQQSFIFAKSLLMKNCNACVTNGYRY